MKPGNRPGYDCGSCGNRCAACRCGACRPGRTPLSGQEAELLGRFAVLPFLPLAREPGTGAAVILGIGTEESADSAVLESLRRKGLVRVEEEPVLRADYSAYEGWLRGSVSLTAAGQDMLDILEYGGGFRDAGEDF